MPSITKKIEKFLRKIINKILIGSKSPILIESTKDVFNQANCKKILLLRQDRIGDLIISTGFVRELRKVFKDSQIDILLGRKNKSSEKSVEKYVDKALILESGISKFFKLLGKIRSEKYDLVIDLLDNSSTNSNLIIKLSKSKHKLGIDKENSPIYDYIVPLADKNKYHIIDRISKIFLAFDLDPNELDFSPEYLMEKVDNEFAKEMLGEKERVRLGINLSGSNRSKYWGEENNINLIKKLKQLDLDIVIFATKDYAKELNQIVDETNARKAPFVSFFHDYASLLHSCDYLISTDTSALHLAASWKLPTVAMYLKPVGGSYGIPWTPYNSPHKALYSIDNDLKNISVESVYKAIVELMEENK